RWTRRFGASFAIADVCVDEIGQTRVHSLVVRFKMYGVSDAETYRRGRSRWSFRRRLQSLLHPVRVDLVQPLRSLQFSEALAASPFLLFITSLRYYGWLREC